MSQASTLGRFKTFSWLAMGFIDPALCPKIIKMTAYNALRRSTSRYEQHPRLDKRRSLRKWTGAYSFSVAQDTLRICRSCWNILDTWANEVTVNIINKNLKVGLRVSNRQRSGYHSTMEVTLAMIVARVNSRENFSRGSQWCLTNFVHIILRVFLIATEMIARRT